MQNRRLGLFFLSVVGLVMFGGILGGSLADYCSKLSQSKCNTLWGLSIISTIGGILSVEVIIIPQGQKNSTKPAKSSDLDTLRPPSLVWGGATLRVIVTSILLSLPIIIQGAYAITVFGGFFGIALAAFIRAVTNNIPPLPEEENTK